MRVPSAFLANRVAWRVFARFVVAGLIPLGVLAILFYAEIRQTLEQRALESLRDTSHSIGQVVLDKLVGTSEMLANIPSFDAEQVSALGLDAVRYDSSGRSIEFGEANVLSHIHAASAAKPVVELIEDSTGAHVVLERTLRDGAVVARLDRQYLSDAVALASGDREACVFAGSLHGDAVFCTEPRLAKIVNGRRDESASTGTFTGSLDGEPWLAGYWQLFVQSRFQGEPWLIVTAMPRSVALESVSVFEHVAPQALALTLLLLTLLSFSQIRRTLEPLSRLLGATRRIAAQDFETRVDVAGNDEFASVARAMNDMAAQLGRQFGTLTTLASMDKLILSSESIENVVAAALGRVGKSTSARDVAVLLLDTDDETHGTLFTRDPDSAEWRSRAGSAANRSRRPASACSIARPPCNRVTRHGAAPSRTNSSLRRQSCAAAPSADCCSRRCPRRRAVPHLMSARYGSSPGDCPLP
jgi:HAMP domain-containing protein